MFVRSYWLVLGGEGRRGRETTAFSAAKQSWNFLWTSKGIPGNDQVPKESDESDSVAYIACLGNGAISTLQ